MLIQRAVEGQPGSVFAMAVLLIKAELGLDGGTVDAEAMKTLAGPLCQLHVLRTVVGVKRERYLQVHTGHHLGVGELPNVDVMAAHDSG